MSIGSRTLLLHSLSRNSFVWPFFRSLTTYLFILSLLPLSLLLCKSCNYWVSSSSSTFSRSVFNFHLLSPFSPCESLPTPSPCPDSAMLASLPLSVTVLLGIVLCFLAIHPQPFISHCSALVLYLLLSCLSILAHLPSYYPSASGCSVNFCVSFVSFPHFSFPLSCLPLRQPEYNKVISHSSALPPSLLLFPLLHPLHLSFGLFFLLPADSAALLVSSDPSFSHCAYKCVCTHTVSVTTCHTLDFVCPLPCSACLRDTFTPYSSYASLLPSFI